MRPLYSRMIMNSFMLFMPVCWKCSKAVDRVDQIEDRDDCYWHKNIYRFSCHGETEEMVVHDKDLVNTFLGKVVTVFRQDRKEKR